MIFDSLNSGILELLSKKYKINKYDDYSINKNKKISLIKLKENIYQNNENMNAIINAYINNTDYICEYDIDILNILVKYININKKLPKQPIKKSYYDYFNEFIGYKQEYKKTFIYFQNLEINDSSLKTKFMNLATNIIGPFSD